ncbi:hypothetical protein PM082_018298 [Marasmius tenuissimus]|nr:hypothetical protein PM082_018298 [Marasmius tenuissimus]
MGQIFSHQPNDILSPKELHFSSTILHDHFLSISTSPGVVEQRDLVDLNHNTTRTPFWLSNSSGRSDSLAGVDKKQKKRREEVLPSSSDFDEVQEKEIVAEEDSNNLYADVDDIDLFGIADVRISGLLSFADDGAGAEIYNPASINTMRIAQNGVLSLWAGHELPADINPRLRRRVRYTLPDLAHWMPRPVRPVDLETKKNLKKMWSSMAA